MVGVLNLTGPSLTSNTAGSSTSTMAVGGILTFTATYTIEQAAAYTGKLINIANVTGSSPGNVGDVSDVSDDGDDNDGNTIDDPTETETFPKAIFEVTKTFTVTQNDGNDKNNANDVINYQIIISNIGSVTLSNLTLNDQLMMVVVVI